MRVKTFIMATSAIGALALSAGVASAEPNGWYGAIDAGWHSADVASNRGVEFEVEDDWAGFARLGYRFNDNWRVEFEGGYRPGEIGEVFVASGAPFVCNVTPAVGTCAPMTDGDLEATTFMANVIYDFGTADSNVRPFIGLGAGVNRVHTKFLGTLASNRAVFFAADDSSTDLAAQAIAGLAFALGDRGHLDITYRYLISNMEVEAFTSAANPSSGFYPARYEDHSLTVGLRYAFGAVEPAYIAPPP
ncbi:MAG: OmpW family outer membrane protein, partial [Brevundimonas sp.]|nr:OmpW family outer membrane protein [Brevundimonas sp.]